MQAIAQLESVAGQGNEPYAVCTLLGWGVVGYMNDGTNNNKAYRLVVANERKIHFSSELKQNKLIPCK